MLDIGCFLDPVVEHHGQRFPNVGTGELVEAVARVAGEDERRIRPAIFIDRGLCIAKVIAGDDRNPLQNIVLTLQFGFRAPVGHDDIFRRYRPSNALGRRLFSGEGAAYNQVNLQPRGRLNDVADPAQVVHARQFDEDLVGAQVVFLNRRFGHTQVVYARLDGVDRLLQRMLLDRLHLGLLHGKGPAVVGPGRNGVLGAVARVKQIAHIAGFVWRRTLNLD